MERGDIPGEFSHIICLGKFPRLKIIWKNETEWESKRKMKPVHGKKKKESGLKEQNIDSNNAEQYVSTFLNL